MHSLINKSTNQSAIFNNKSISPAHSDEEICALLTDLKLSRARICFQEKKPTASFSALSFNDQLFEIMAPERDKRRTNSYHRRLQKANRESTASASLLIERAKHYGLTRNQVEYLLSCKWFDKFTLVVIGASGTGKTDLCSCIIDAACLAGSHAANYSYPLFALELSAAMQDAISFQAKMKQICAHELIVLDDFCLSGTPRAGEADAMKLFLDHCKSKHCGLVLASQIKPTGWLEYFGGGVLAEAIVERILTVQKYSMIQIKGQSMRSGNGTAIPDNKEENSGTTGQESADDGKEDGGHD